MVEGPQGWTAIQISGDQGWLELRGAGLPFTSLELQDIPYEIATADVSISRFAASAAGASGSHFEIVVPPNFSGVTLEATILVTSGNSWETLVITQEPVMANVQGTRVVECFNNAGYMNAISETGVFAHWTIKAAASMPIWYFTRVSGNVFTIRNYTTGLFLTANGGSLSNQVASGGSTHTGF